MDNEYLKRIYGLLESGATLGTGAVSGLVGMPYGLYKGVTSGAYGTPQAPRIAAREAQQFMERNTYQPRTAEGQANLQQLAGLLEASKLPPVMPEASLLAAIPKQAYAAQAERAGMAAEKAIAPVVTRTMERGGLPAQLLGDLSQGSRRQIFVPASQEEALQASKLLKKKTPQEVWEETGVGKFAGEYVKEISDKSAKFNTAEEIASDAQKIRDRNVELKQTIKESQSTYPDLFPKELTAARRPLREEIKANQGLLERNYGYESDPKWAGNFAQLAYEHPELYKEFPQLKNVVVRQGRDDPGFLGSYQRAPHLEVGSVDVTKSGLLQDPRSTATHEMQHAVSDLSGWQAGGAPEMFKQQKEAELTRDAINWNKEIENAKKRYPDEDRSFLESVVVNDYVKNKVGDWIPSIESRDMARLFSKYPEQLDEAQNLIKVYGLDRKTTPNSPDKVYKNLEGEALARLAQTRIDLDEAERLKNYPFVQKTESYKYGLDVNPDDLIYRDTVEGLLGRSKAAEATDLLSYRGSHTAPGPDFGAPLHDLTGGGQMYPADVYSTKAAQYYGTGYPKADKEAFALANKVRGNPDAEVMMYRAVPKDASIESINTGDWVTLSKDYAKNHGEAVLDNDYKIISKKVKAKDLWTNADSIHEFGYWPE